MKANFLSLEHAVAARFCEADRQIGAFFGQLTADFIVKHQIAALDFVSSHGHTIFHEPEKGFTVQVGHGATLAAHCGFPVVCDFRSTDVALGGQGAPLVPIGDLLLFSEYQACLNLGGIANISFLQQNECSAFDIVPANMVLNILAEKVGKMYDHNGDLAKAGNINPQLVAELNALPFFRNANPKSLGKEWVLKMVYPILEKYSSLPVIDLLASACEHIAFQVAQVWVLKDGMSKMLVTGGGAFNSHLIAQISAKLVGKCEVIIPDEKTVKFKEAIIFALLGLLRVKNLPNGLKSVTGASADSVGGCIYL